MSLVRDMKYRDGLHDKHGKHDKHDKHDKPNDIFVPMAESVWSLTIADM